MKLQHYALARSHLVWQGLGIHILEFRVWRICSIPACLSALHTGYGGGQLTFERLEDELVEEVFG